MSSVLGEAAGWFRILWDVAGSIAGSSSSFTREKSPITMNPLLVLVCEDIGGEVGQDENGVETGELDRASGRAE